MSSSSENSTSGIMYRRWAYMLIAIVASAVLLNKPVFDFQEDKGIIYVRSFSMDQHTFYVTQTSIDTGISEITATSSLEWLYRCNKAMLWGCILCFFCFFSSRLRIGIAYGTALIAGAYYVLMMYYAMQISDLHYATLSPNYIASLPAIVCYFMIMTAQNVVRDGVIRADEAMDSYDVE